MPPLPPAARITAGELVLVCSRYDLGSIQSLRRIKGGSRESPKILIVSDRGRFLMKRRAPQGGSGTPSNVAARVALSHQVQLYLGSRGIPVAPLVGTRDQNNSLLELRGYIYEVFRFVSGRRYGRSAAAADAAGRLLASMHIFLSELKPSWTPPDATYHAHPAVAPSIDDLIGRTREPELRGHLAALRDAYVQASAEASRLGADQLPTQLIHGDWHPGNLLYAPDSERVAAVLDFDSVRLGATAFDLANGALQFAVARRPLGEAAGSDDDDRGRAGIRVRLEPELLRAFASGYLSESQSNRLPTIDPSVLPWLMIEAMVVETVAPIVATGQFGKVSARAALQMTRQAVAWISERAPYLVSLIGSR